MLLGQQLVLKRRGFGPSVQGQGLKGCGRDGGVFRKMVSIWGKQGNIAHIVILLNVGFHIRWHLQGLPLRILWSTVWQCVISYIKLKGPTVWSETVLKTKTLLVKRHFHRNTFCWHLYFIFMSNSCYIISSWDFRRSSTLSMSSRKYAIILWEIFLWREGKTIFITKTAEVSVKAYSIYISYNVDLQPFTFQLTVFRHGQLSEICFLHG